MTFPIQTMLAAAMLALAANASAADSTKDIVLDRVNVPAAAGAPLGDAMAVSVLLETPSGTLIPKSTNSLFRTGDRFRVKLLASRDATVSLYNTNPRGETGAAPVWQGQVKFGMETITPRLALTGNSGVDQLHIVMAPRQQQQQQGGVLAWLTDWRNAFKGADASKDIRLDVQNTPTTTYLVNASGQGLVSTVKIVHAAH
ncbi:MAG: hypothetical protein V4857_11315 [Pseudomonadota bacterium]